MTEKNKGVGKKWMISPRNEAYICYWGLMGTNIAAATLYSMLIFYKQETLVISFSSHLEFIW